MILAIECVVLCVIFTLIILPAQYKDPMVMIMSYPPNVIKRVEQLPQYAGCIKQKEKKHISKKIFGLFFFAVLLAIVAYFSGCREFVDTFFHVKGAIKGTILGMIVAILSGVIILLAV